ncbi:hypothetical protein XENOCAPTIV_027292 [Xenoophorus captivus]|uniref:Uncharacterized protein n=1 Tax=Xenoophorus captivus TaxID=1517983 RepID=A0ABV0RCE7_9TELE
MGTSRIGSESNVYVSVCVKRAYHSAPGVAPSCSINDSPFIHHSYIWFSLPCQEVILLPSAVNAVVSAASHCQSQFFLLTVLAIISLLLFYKCRKKISSENEVLCFPKHFAAPFCCKLNVITLRIKMAHFSDGI